MKSGRSRLWLIALAVGGILVVGALLVVLASSRTTVRVNVCSVPEGATIFDGHSALGFTPLPLTLARGEVRNLRIVRRDYRDAEVEVRADAFIPSGTFGALRNPPRDMIVQLQPVAEDQPTTNTGMTSSAHAPDAIADYYRALIREEPGMLGHYAELAHHFVVNAEFNEAAAVLREGFDALTTRSDVVPEKYFYELHWIYVRYYVYPPETPGNRVRPTCRELLQQALSKGLGGAKTIQNFVTDMDRYDVAHPPELEPGMKSLKRAK